MTSRTVDEDSYTLTYGAENRLRSVSGEVSADFVYDGDGNRMMATLGKTTTYYIGDHYAFIPAGAFAEDFEGSTGHWRTSGLWHVTTEKASSPAHSAWYGQESTGDYDTGERTTGTLEVTLPGTITANSVLSFNYWREVESYSGAYDQTVVQLSTDGGATWSDLWYRDSSDPSQATWLSSGDINLGAYAGAVEPLLRFRFDSVDGVANNYAGWFVDDVSVTDLGSVTRKYYAAGGEGTAKRVAMTENDTLYWLLTDHLGSTAVTAHSDGSKKAELRYKAWGETRYEWGETPTTYRFTGQREDATIGLYYYGQPGNYGRYYDPALSRWTQPDPIVPEPGDPQDLNRYTYVRNNPLGYIDPDGQCPAPARGSGSAICIAWFIPMKDALFLKGDGREFSTDSDPSKSRAYVHLYLEDGTLRTKVVVNPSTLLLPGRELRRVPHEVYMNEGESISIQLKRAALGLGNKVSIHYEQDEIRIGFDLNQSATYISPAGINGQIRLTRRGGEWVSAGERDRFPALEMYYYEDGEARQTIYQGEPHSRNWFWGPVGGLVPAFPNERWDHISSTQQSGLHWALATKVQ